MRVNRRMRAAGLQCESGKHKARGIDCEPPTELFQCVDCGQWHCTDCEGADDDKPESCDACWAKAQRGRAA